MPGIPCNCYQINISNVWKQLKAPRIVTKDLNPSKTKGFSNFESAFKAAGTIIAIWLFLRTDSFMFG